jgi:membrane protein YqaA with SNARE-associated domain
MISMLSQVVDAAAAAAPHHSRFGFLKKWNIALLALLKPLGIWGIGVIALIDAGAIPMPLDAMVIDYAVHDHARAALFCLMAAFGSALGSLLWYFIGRAGGELVLLKRIDRKRYEQLRDRFEKQEFLAIMVPAMAPPPFPMKLFELAAGVFEMKLAWYFSAIFLGKFLRFLVVSFLIIFFGRRILNTLSGMLHFHRGLVLSGCGILLLLLAIWVIRKLFDRRRGTEFPVEDEG